MTAGTDSSITDSRGSSYGWMAGLGVRVRVICEGWMGVGDGQIIGWIDGRTDEWVDGQMNDGGWLMDGWIDG